MRYVLGISIINKETGEVQEGIATICRTLGLYPSLSKIESLKNRIESLQKDDRDYPITIVYENLDDVKKDISKCAKAFRRDDVWHAHQKWDKSKYIHKFYPIKVDSSKFPFKFEEEYVAKNKKNKNEKIFYFSLK